MRHMDDFGSAYSSLNILHEFPFDTLKIDRSFIHDLAKNEHNLEIVRAIIKLGYNLNKKVIAEGIESLEDLNILRASECEFVQGFYLADPMPAGQAGDFLANHLAGHQRPGISPGHTLDTGGFPA